MKPGADPCLPKKKSFIGKQAKLARREMRQVVCNGGDAHTRPLLGENIYFSKRVSVGTLQKKKSIGGLSNSVCLSLGFNVNSTIRSAQQTPVTSRTGCAKFDKPSVLIFRPNRSYILQASSPLPARLASCKQRSLFSFFF